jgi:Na+/proline symporter
MKMSYGRFAAMIATSTLVMFALMYLNTYVLDHVLFSQTRMWMALLMGATMALIMLGFMWGMYRNRAANFGIVAGSVAVFALSLWLVRSQETVGEVAYMKAMIPHHSIAIMTSERAHIKDPEVRKLADGIIDAQVREIAEMKRMIARLEARPSAADAPDLPSYRDRNVPPPPPQTDESTGINTLQTE